jgi:hypothetical protein
MGTTVFGNFPGVPSKEKTGSAQAAPDIEQAMPDIDNASTNAAVSRRTTCDIAIEVTPNSSSFCGQARGIVTVSVVPP